MRGAIPPGGFVGTLMASGLHAAFNSVGAHVVALASFLRRFSSPRHFPLRGTHALVRGPLKKLDPIGRLKARWAAWQEKREQERLRKRVEANKLSGRQPVPTQTIGVAKNARPPRKRTEAAEEEGPKAAEEDDTAAARPVFMPEIAAPRRGGKEIRCANRRSRAARRASGCLRRACCAWPSAAKRFRKTN